MFQPTGGLKVLSGNLGHAIIKTSAVKPERRVIEAPAIRVEHDLRYALAAPLVRGAATWLLTGPLAWQLAVEIRSGEIARLEHAVNERFLRVEYLEDLQVEASAEALLDRLGAHEHRSYDKWLARPAADLA